MPPTALENDSQVSTRQALAAVQHLLLYARLPADLPEALRTDPLLQEITGHVDTLRQFALALGNGDLEPELSYKIKGPVAGALKTLQGNLRHLTWQAQQIASGDLSQRVHYLGDFADAFNSMVENLSQSHQALDIRAKELSEGRRAALNLMLDAQKARQETDNAYEMLQAQMEEIKTLQDQLREQAIRDSLTGCFNRRYLVETLEREFSRAEREKYPISLVMLDIDHFKQVNDQYGHPAGDVVLRELGSRLRQRMRAGDIVCRYGGEEFLLLLPNLTLDAANTRMEALRLEIQEMQVRDNATRLQVTVSIGIATYPVHAADSEGLIQLADQALYQAKNNGRNQVKTPT